MYRRLAELCFVFFVFILLFFSSYFSTICRLTMPCVAHFGVLFCIFFVVVANKLVVTYWCGWFCVSRLITRIVVTTGVVGCHYSTGVVRIVSVN